MDSTSFEKFLVSPQISSLQSSPLARISSNSKGIRPGRQIVSIKDRPDGSKSPILSFHASKMTSFESKDNIQNYQSLQPSFSKTSDFASKEFSRIQNRSPILISSLDKSVRIKKRNFSVMKSRMSPEPDLVTLKSANASVFPEHHSSQNIQFYRDLEFTKQEEYIKSNPHFKKFNSTVYTLDKLETEKLPLSKELFYYPDRLKAIEEFLKNSKRHIEKDDNFSVAMRVLKENRKEEVTAPEGKTCYLKIYTRGKSLPLKVNIEVKYGSYEIFVSRINEKPSFDNCDFYYSSDQFDVDYGELNDDLHCLYFGINAVEQLKMFILCSFLVKPNARKSIDISYATPKQRIAKFKPKGAYEFFRKDIDPERLRQFEELIAEIKAERRQKALLISKGKNWLSDNKETASEFNKVREIQLVALGQKFQAKLEKSREKREKVQSEKKHKRIYEALRTDIHRIGAEYLKNKEKKKQLRFRFDGSWAVVIAIFFIARGILEKKRAMIALNLIRRMKDSYALRIQRMTRRFFDKMRIVRMITPNSNNNNEVTFQTNEPYIRNQIKIYECLNSIALLARKVKEQKAGSVLVLLLKDSIVPFSIVEASATYTKKIKKIQELWRIKAAIFSAKVEVFSKAWNNFYSNLLATEMKSKKKKYLPFLSQITEYQVLKYGKRYLRQKASRLRRNLEALSPANKGVKRSDDTKDVNEKGEYIHAYGFSSTFIQQKITSPQTDNKISKQAKNLKPKQETNIKALKKQENPHVDRQKIERLIVPTQEELKGILDKIIEELKEQNAS